VLPSARRFTVLLPQHREQNWLGLCCSRSALRTRERIVKRTETTAVVLIIFCMLYEATQTQKREQSTVIY
jgi:hypothetical protein